LERHLVKKLARLETFESLECHDKILSYEACDYLADLIKERGTTPLKKVELQRTFCSENVEEEEIV
jgi:hypothetical protein